MRLRRSLSTDNHCQVTADFRQAPEIPPFFIFVNHILRKEKILQVWAYTFGLKGLSFLWKTDQRFTVFHEKITFLIGSVFRRRDQHCQNRSEKTVETGETICLDRITTSGNIVVILQRTITALFPNATKEIAQSPGQSFFLLEPRESCGSTKLKGAIR